jgi:hypothetical protein
MILKSYVWCCIILHCCIVIMQHTCKYQYSLQFKTILYVSITSGVTKCSFSTTVAWNLLLIQSFFFQWYKSGAWWFLEIFNGWAWLGSSFKTCRFQESMFSFQIAQCCISYYFALVLGNNSFVFSSYLQLKKMTEDIHLILDALASSSLLEVQVAMLF